MTRGPFAGWVVKSGKKEIIVKNKSTLQAAARNGGIVIETKYAFVDVSNTSTIWGEGPNVHGYRLAFQHDFEMAGAFGQLLNAKTPGAGYMAFRRESRRASME